MSKKVSRIIGICMLLIAICFIMYALNNPQSSFNIPLNYTYTLYGIYVIVTIIFLIAPFKEKTIERIGSDKKGYWKLK